MRRSCRINSTNEELFSLLFSSKKRNKISILLIYFTLSRAQMLRQDKGNLFPRVQLEKVNKNLQMHGAQNKSNYSLLYLAHNSHDLLVQIVLFWTLYLCRICTRICDILTMLIKKISKTKWYHNMDNNRIKLEAVMGNHIALIMISSAR